MDVYLKRQHKRYTNALRCKIHEICGYCVRDDDLLVAMVCHTSVLRARSNCIYFQKLEFLGDKVLAICVANILYDVCEDEAQMSRKLAFITGTESLKAVAKKYFLDCFVIASSARNSSALADMMEAVIAGIYLDGGLDIAQKFVTRAFDSIIHSPDKKDNKSLLQEYSQAHKCGLPEYIFLEKTGPEHALVFRVGVRCCGKYAEGVGHSLKSAEHNAASNILKMYGDNSGSE